MCWANKCCYFIKLDLGCVLIGIISLLFSTTMTISSGVFLLMNTDGENQEIQYNSIHHTKMTPDQVSRLLAFGIKLPALRIILFSTLALGLLLKLASILLLVGIKKKNPGFILFYFGFGIFFTILSQLGALLLFLQTLWVASLIILIACCIFIHFLVVIHTLYDDLYKGRKMNSYSSLDRLVEDDTISVGRLEIDRS